MRPSVQAQRAAAGVHDTSRRGSRLRRLLSTGTWVLAIAGVAAWFVFLRPAGMGGPAGYVIVSGESMEPVMSTGDLAVVRRQAAYGVGDVVAYQIPKSDVGGGMLVIHRVVGGDVNQGLVLQGDNRDTPDVWRPRQADVVGSLQWHIPHAGTAMFLLRTPIVLGGVLGFFGFWLIATSGRKSTPADDDEAPEQGPDCLAAAPSEPAAVRVSVPSRVPANAAAAGVVLVSLAAFALRQSARR